MIDKYPTVCNLCGGKVIYTSNARIYGKEYGRKVLPLHQLWSLCWYT